MTTWERCPGCGHNYGWGFTEKSNANENGYCGWCRDEGVFSAESEKAMMDKANAEHEARRKKEDEEWRAKYGDNGEHWF